MKNRQAVITSAAFIATVWAANWLTHRYGFVPVGFGLSATAGTYMAGLSFGLRDVVHEASGRIAVIALIVGGAILSALVSPSLALASGVAFLVAELADLSVYDPLRKRGWVLAVILSNLVGALVDTVLFLHLAGFPIKGAIAGQMLGKAWMILPALVLMGAVRRNK